jgi:putative DNA primase/helicase
MNTAFDVVDEHQQDEKYMNDKIHLVIPTELQQIKQFITWKAGPSKPGGKFDKIPVGKDGSSLAWQQSYQLMTIEEALSAKQQRGHSGIGLVLPAITASGKHIVGLDYDSVDLSAGNDDPRMAEILSTHKLLGEPYIEKSPSGKGLRMFVLSSVKIEQISSANPLGGKDELFCSSGKWVTVTGNALGGSGVPDATQEIQQLSASWIARNIAAKKTVATKKINSPPAMLSHLLPQSSWNGWPDHKIHDDEGRESKMLSYAGHLRSRGFLQPEIDRMCLQANIDHYADRLEEEVVLDRARRYAKHGNEVKLDSSGSGINFDFSLLEKVDRTDAGNVALLFNLTASEIRFIYELKIWIVWHNGRWHYDKPNALIYLRLLLVSAHYYGIANKFLSQAESNNLEESEVKKIVSAAKAISKWAEQCRNKNLLDSMLSLAQRDPRFLISVNLIDADPWLLGVQNGVVNLKIGTLSQDSKQHFVLKRCPVNFNPNAKSLRWDGFIKEITSSPDGIKNGKVNPKPSPELAKYLQKALGYSITGRVNEHVMFIATGSGANGKNVLLDTVKAIGGDYMETIAPEVLMATKLESGTEQASPSVRKLAGARCAISSESKEGQKLDIAVVKRHTGGGSMSARALHENPVTFDITHKLWLLTNHTPQIDHIDSATKGRLNMIPFRMKWNRPIDTRPDPTLENADKNLMDKLNEEQEGILLWLIEGAVRYHKEGLNPPAEVTAFTQDYIQSQDSFTRWINECEFCSVDDGPTAGDLFINYDAFCKAEEEHRQIDSAAQLAKRLKDRGYQSKKTRDGSRYNLRPKPNSGAWGEVVSDVLKNLNKLEN